MLRRNRWTIAVWIAVALTFSLTAAPGRATPQRRDVAPVSLTAEEGYTLGPAEITSIQMVTETVTIDVDAAMTFTPVNEPTYERQWPGAAVTADFLMRNAEATAITLNVGFPMLPPPVFGVDVQPGDLVFALSNLHAYVNGLELPTTEATVSGQPWRVWAMTFSPGDTLVRVTYWQPVLGDHNQTDSVALGYVLQTGAAWAGSIERADLIVNFPYPVEGLFLEDGQTGFAVDGNALRWHFEALEPTPDHDLRLRMVSPARWVQVLQERSALQAEPSADAYASLARSYADILYSRLGREVGNGREPEFHNRELAQVTEALYRKALELAPDDVYLHGDFATFLTAAGGGLLPEARLVDAAAEYQYLARNFSGGYDYLYQDLLASAGTAVPDAYRIQATQDAAGDQVTDTALPTAPLDVTGTAILPSATAVAPTQPRPATATAISAVATASGNSPTEPAPVLTGVAGVGLIACFLLMFAAAVGGFWLLRRKRAQS